MSHVVLYIYLYSILTNVREGLPWVCTIGFFAGVIGCIGGFLFGRDAEQSENHGRRETAARERQISVSLLSSGKRLLWMFAVTLVILTLIPSDKIIITMVAASVGRDVVTSETAAHVGDKASHLIDSSADLVQQWIDQKKQEIQKSESK